MNISRLHAGAEGSLGAAEPLLSTFGVGHATRCGGSHGDVARGHELHARHGARHRLLSQRARGSSPDSPGVSRGADGGGAVLLSTDTEPNCARMMAELFSSFISCAEICWKSLS